MKEVIICGSDTSCGDVCQVIVGRNCKHGSIVQVTDEDFATIHPETRVGSDCDEYEERK